MWEIGANDQLFKAADYEPLVVAYRKGRPCGSAMSAQAVDSVEDIRQAGFTERPALRAGDRFPAARRQHYRHGGSHPRRAAATWSRPSRAFNLTVAMDQTVTIRASVQDVEIDTDHLRAAGDSGGVFLSAQRRTTFIPSVAVPVSLIGTFGVMYLLDYSIDNLSLMALTISTGFVVDDAIVVIENITRYLEQGMRPFEAALKGAAGNRLYGDDDQLFADRRVYSAAADGRHRRPPVPRIRGDAFGGDRWFRW